MSYVYGEVLTSEYGIWKAMKQRCNNPNNKSFRNYGGRGIQVCMRWLNYANFLADVGRRPSSKLTLGRIDNNGNYEPNNCEWQTYTKQARNRRNVKLTIIEINRIRRLFEAGKTCRELSKKFKVTRTCIKAITCKQNWN